MKGREGLDRVGRPMPLTKLRLISLASVVVMAACSGGNEPAAEPEPAPTTATQSPTDAGEVAIEVTLPDVPGDEIPVEFTCEGADEPPTIEWAGPVDAAEWIVTVTDPDAPGGTFVHWVVYRIPPGTTAISGPLPTGAYEGMTSSGDAGYGGPCPPEGDDPHEYVFTVTALSEPLDLPEGAPPEEVQEAAQCCVMGSGRVSAFFGR